MEIDGVKMVHLKTLGVFLGNVPDDILLQLRELVESVVDLETLPSFVEVEV